MVVREVQEKGSGLFCGNGPEGATHKRVLTPFPAQAVEEAWRNCLLYDEHTWGAHTAGREPESEFTKAQWAIKSQFAHLAGQDGDFTFRFAITSRRVNPAGSGDPRRARADNVASARFGWGVASPLQAIAIGANPGGTLPCPMAGLIEIAEPNVLLVGPKRAEADESLVLRLWEVTGQATTAHVRLPFVPFQKARAASLVEEVQEPLEIRDSAVAVPIRACGLATVLLE